MKYKLLAIVFIIAMMCNQQAAAQSKERYEAQKIKDRNEVLQRQPETVIDVAKATFLFPGFSYEKSIGKFQTLHAYALYNIYTYTKSGYGVTESKNYFDPTLMLGYRYYCNYNRRLNMGKFTERNSMNYVSALAQVFFSKIPVGDNAYENSTRRPVYIFGVLYGLQRNYKSRFSLDINFGLGIITSKSHYYNGYTGLNTEGNQSQATIPGQVTLGFWLGKR